MIEFDSASAIVGSTVTGRHLLRVEDYSQAKLLPVDEPIESQPLSVGGRTWRIRCYPSGMHMMGVPLEHSSEVYFIVVLDDSIPEPAFAETSFILLDRAGNEIPGPFTAQRSFIMREHLRKGDGGGVMFLRGFVESPECLADDCFKIRVDIRVFTGSRSENRWTMAPSALLQPDDLQRQLGDLLVAGEGADVTFQVVGETFRAHRCILAARSPVFKAELFGAMRHSDGGAEVCIQVHDMEPDVFSALLHFLYTDSLPPEMMTEQAVEEEVVMAQHLLEAADRYGMERLKLACEEKLCRCLETRTAATTLVLADQHQCHRLKKACIEFLRSPQNLNTVIATDGFELISRSYPTLLKQLISKVTAAFPCDME